MRARTSRLPGALLCLLGAPIAVRASLITSDFTVNATAGSQAGRVASGSFADDDGIVPAGGGPTFGPGLLSDLAFTSDGISRDETTANTRAFLLTPTGDLFGPSCSLVCQLRSWWVDGHRFVFVDVHGPSVGGGTVTINRVAAIAEPAMLALLSIGLVALQSTARRKRET